MAPKKFSAEARSRGEIWPPPLCVSANHILANVATLRWSYGVLPGGARSSAEIFSMNAGCSV